MVYHIVPEGVPVYQAKAFFAENPHLEMNASWSYREQFGRHFADFGVPTFM
jgi:hypothetical protein